MLIIQLIRYAIVKALREKQRVIYTTPIKALSNQKFQDFNDKHLEVGLLTGDATINVNAGLLIMTTEILQSMLYRLVKFFMYAVIVQICSFSYIYSNPSTNKKTLTLLDHSAFRGSSIMREVGWVVFDEIHYMRDPERGVVWEESLVLLPDSVRFVFLSATTPNARQFAEWIAYLHDQPCNVVSTDTRPVPLQHYVYPLGGDGLHLVLNEVCCVTC